jgi:prepilin-type N-terminal cleavage/methylation domain-containing protein
MQGLFIRCTRRCTKSCTRGSKGPAFLKSGTFGFSFIELLTTLAILGILIGLAAPSYQSAVEKRRLSQGAELIVAFVNTVQGESIKRNRKVTVSYATGVGGQWCIGANFGLSACDCMETNPAAPAWCGQDGVPWVLRQDDVDADNLVQSVSGDGAYVFDPVRGLFIDRGDMLTLALSTGEGQFQASVSVISTGKVSVCLPEASSGFHEFKPCPQGL